MLRDFLHMIYPRTCKACGSPLASSENDICSWCMATLPYTHYPVRGQNALSSLFRGRLRIDGAASLFYFDKESRVQNLVHRIKYKGEKELAQRLGIITGENLPGLQCLPCEPLLVPVPLHPRKQKRRGYNQAEELARGLAQSRSWEMAPGCLERKKFTETQTHKSRAGRWENVEEVFCVKEPATVKGKYIMLVDDVLTTGATLEACGSSLLASEAEGIYIVTLACAVKL